MKTPFFSSSLPSGSAGPSSQLPPRSPATGRRPKTFFRRRHLFAFLAICLLPLAASAQTAGTPLPTPAQFRWQEAELGVVFHYDLHVFDGKIYNQTANRLYPVDDYNLFAPTHLDTDQWIRAARAAGARFAILTATHETGFGLWQSDANPYCLKAVKWRNGQGDIVRDFVNSCRKYGLEPGIYVGIRWNSRLGVHNFRVTGNDESARIRQAWYKRMCEKMVTELCTRYGDLFMIWFDGGADDPAGDGPDVEPIVNRYQPGCLFYHNVHRADLRWGGSETGTVAYPCWATFPTRNSHNKNTDGNAAHRELLKHGDPAGAYWMPAMADSPLRGANGRHEWFWEPGDDDRAVYSLATLTEMYEKSVGRNATLVLGLTPNPDGLLPDGDVQRLRELGDEIRRRFSEPVAATTSGKGKSITLKFGKEQRIDYYLIQENILRGERVRKYRIEARVNGRWVQVTEGSAVGHKRIGSFPAVTATACRLVIDASTAPPDITRFQVYEVEPLPGATSDR